MEIEYIYISTLKKTLIPYNIHIHSISVDKCAVFVYAYTIDMVSTHYPPIKYTKFVQKKYHTYIVHINTIQYP